MGWGVNRHGYAGGVKGQRIVSEVDIEHASQYGAKLTRKVVEHRVDMSTVTGTGTITATVTGAIPAGAILALVSAKVLVVLAGTGLTTWSLGVTGDTDRFAAGKAKTAGVTVTPADYAADNACFDISQAAVDILFTGAAGQFDTGVVRLSVFYWSLSAPAL